MNKLIENKSFLSQARKPVAAALLIAGISGIGTAQAVLNTGDILSITNGVTGGSYGFVTGGSYFGMDQSGDSSIQPGERTPITSTGSIVMGVKATATGSHNGAINGTENPAFDIWNFFSNTGMDYFTVAPTDNNNGTLDWSGWTVTWNFIAAIPMSTNAWQPGNCAALGCTGLTFTNGNAHFSQVGSDYTLRYSATVPLGDPSGFGGVQYYLNLIGTVTTPGAVTAAVVGGGAATVTAGSLGAIRVGEDALPVSDPDTSITYPIGLFYDFVVTGLTGGEQVNVVIPLSTALPDNAVYRKYNSATGLWSDFVVDAFNSIRSAPGTPDACPAPGNVAYTAGLTPGRYCIQLTILNGGANDTGSADVTVIRDPGGIATGIRSSTAAAVGSTTSGCSLSQKPTSLAHKSDWLMVFGFLSWLGMLIHRRKRTAE